MNTNIIYICVLAGGLDKNGNVNEFVIPRLDKAIEIFNNNKDNCFILCLGGGTYHKPPNLNSLNYVIHESTSCSHYLRDAGIPEDKIMREWSSYDTIANGFFCYTNFILPLKIENLILITSDFHMKRSQCIFDYFIDRCPHQININYISVSNEMISEDILKERQKRELDSYNNFKKEIVDKKLSIKEFTEWLFTKHNAYRAIVNYYPMDNKLNNTY